MKTQTLAAVMNNLVFSMIEYTLNYNPSHMLNLYHLRLEQSNGPGRHRHQPKSLIIDLF